MCQHDIVKAAVQMLPAKHPRGPRFLTLELRYAKLPPVATAPVRQDPDASAKPNVPVISSAATARARKVISAAYSLGDAPSKFSAQLGSSHRTVLKSRSRSRYLQLVSCADGIGPSQVVICSAHDEGQARMRKSPCEGCFVLHQSAHSICDGHRSPSSDPPRPIQCSASDGSKILCEDPALFNSPSCKSICLNMK